MSATATAAGTPEPTPRHDRLLERARQRDEPSQTRTVRQRYAQRLRGRWDAIAAAIREGVVERDAFGLQTEALVDAPSGGQFDFPKNADKVEAFRRWLDRKTEAEILRQFGRDNQFIERAYERGVEDARAELRALGLIEGEAAATATQLPVHSDQLARLFSRNFRALEGMTTATGQEMGRVLSEGLAGGDGPEDIARSLADRIDAVGRTRATVIARTEVMNSHNAARIQEWERAGVSRVGVLIAADACPVCQAYKAGEPYPASNAYGNLPKHPNCRCSHHVWTEADR
jgi:SPP1 gp7 family putative phage head morphogenesis protein